MKVSISWLKTLIDTDQTVDELAHALTMAGLEVEEISTVAAAFTDIVVAEVLSVAPHPNADKLRVTVVDAGQGGSLQIVCGAPNVVAGMRVPCALVGARLPGLDIKAATLRGVESNGMLCSARELGLSEDHGGLLTLPDDAPIGMSIRDYLDLDDTVLTLKITPNRGDCLSMAGVARDLAAVTGAKVKLPAPPASSGKNASNAAPSNEFRAVTLAAGSACPRYLGRVITGIDARATTPDWMKRRLTRGGFRPISPLVDITNYINLERGQPMHAFDNTKLTGAIEVRFANPGETLLLLNDQAVTLSADMLLISDATGPLAMAGVMGGKASMVTDETTNVFFEAAFFAPDVIKGKTRTLGINSDAAFRFERGVDPLLCVETIELATRLAIDICGTHKTQVGPITDARLNVAPTAPIRVRVARVGRIIGMPVVAATITAALQRLGCKTEQAAGTAEETILVTPPSYRFDLAIEEDIIEEVARIVGYENVPSIAPRSSAPMLHIPEARRSKSAIRHRLAAAGFQEVINYSFVAESWELDFCANASPVRIANPIAAQLAVMRSSLLAGLCQTLVGNLNRGESRLKLFELGRCFLASDADLAVQPERLAGLVYGSRHAEQWGESNAEKFDFFGLKGEVQAFLNGREVRFEKSVHPALHPGRSARLIESIGGVEQVLGVIGELHPRLQQRLDLPGSPILFELDLAPLLGQSIPAYAPISRTPAVRRDIAVVVAENVEVGALIEAVNAQKQPIVSDFALFDLYRGQGLSDGTKSLAFRILMQDTARTLTDVECNAAVAQIVEVMSQKFDATIRK